jgi:hypothetical protein
LRHSSGEAEISISVETNIWSCEEFWCFMIWLEGWHHV